MKLGGNVEDSTMTLKTEDWRTWVVVDGYED